MINVACVKVGSLYGADYVNKLFDGVRRNLAAGLVGRFVCFTEDPTGLHPAIVVKPVPKELATRGWWAKLYLFSGEAFSPGERVLYFDLDTCITGPLDGIAAYLGRFAVLNDVYRPGLHGSGVMAWEAGTLTHLYEDWIAAGRPDCERGDQEWLEREPAEFWQQLFPGRFKSYKVHCIEGIPDKTSVVYFHGLPRPHQVTEGWVPEVWKVGGGSALEFLSQRNVSEETLIRNVLSTRERKRWLREMPAHASVALIVGGGPSLAENLFYVRGMQLAGGAVFALNAAYGYLVEHEIRPAAHVLLDARPENRVFVPADDSPKYYASQCDPTVLDAAGENLICWHAHEDAYAHYAVQLRGGDLLVGGGSTVGLKALAIAYTLGFRDIRLFGFDSSYRESHHAYPQPLNEGERTVEAKVNGEVFKAAPWMVAQAREFAQTAVELLRMECSLSVYGEGLLPTVFRTLRGETHSNCSHGPSGHDRATAYQSVASARGTRH